MKKIGVYFSILLLCQCSQSKPSEETADYYDRCRELVLSEAKINQEYFFKRGDSLIDELAVMYLGEVKTAKGAGLKFLNSTNFTGLSEGSRKANSKIYIYDDRDNEVGRYYLGSKYALPTAVINGNLQFSYNDSSCNQSTSISFIDSIPRQIFIKCKGDAGDLYVLEKGKLDGK